MRIAFVGGGTGGHFYPLLAVAEEIRARDASQATTSELIYIGPDAYNKAALDQLGITFIYCPAGKQRRYASILNFFDRFKIISGFFVAVFKLWYWYPDVLFSKGSFTSVPVVLAAAFLRIPIVIHESDAVPGRANSLAKRFARYIAISYPEAGKFFPEAKTALTGIPVRRALLAPITNPRAVLGITEETPILFVTGGSSGAERVNNLILDSLDELLPHYIIIHQVGEANLTSVKQTATALIRDQEALARYFIQGHMPGELFAAALSAATVVISRAGSTSLTEIALKGKPSIIIPIPEDISHDQRTNAYSYARTGAGSVMEEHNLTDSLLVAEIRRITEDPNIYNEMVAATQTFTHPAAAVTLADMLTTLAVEH